MSNVLAFHPKIRPSRSGNLAALAEAVALHRRSTGDVFWLKENAEFLNILAAMGAPVSAQTLAPYEAFCDAVEERLRFYPQYYRFFLSMILDLEDLGLDQGKGDALCDWVAARGLIEAEMSDLQRAEARRLLARRLGERAALEDGLADRLRRFVERSETFAVPNKKAAYELTHIVFYLSRYGQVDPQLGPEAVRSLEYAGLVAYIDQNHDLLAEVCTSLRFVGVEPNRIWSDAVAAAHGAFVPQVGTAGEIARDGYHAFMVTGWAQAVAGRASFEAEIPQGAVCLAQSVHTSSALRPVSECLYELGSKRSHRWPGMRGQLVPALSSEHQMVMQLAEDSSDMFEDFFAAFARAS